MSSASPIEHERATNALHRAADELTISGFVEIAAVTRGLANIIQRDAERKFGQRHDCLESNGSVIDVHQI